MSAADPFAELANHLGERLDHAWTPARGAALADALVVLAHGVTSHHDRPYLVALSEALADAGLASLRVSFAGNGRSAGRFEESTISKEVLELGAVLDACEAAGMRRVAYAGHSMGAAVGVLRAAEDARIAALVSLAGMTHVTRFTARHFGSLVPGRDCMLGRPACPLSREFVDDALGVDTTLAAAARVRAPWLLVHGTADELVPPEDSAAARAAADGRPELVELAGVDHRFTDALEPLAEAVVPWLRRALGA